MTPLDTFIEQAKAVLGDFSTSDGCAVNELARIAPLLLRIVERMREGLRCRLGTKTSCLEAVPRSEWCIPESVLCVHCQALADVEAIVEGAKP